MKIKSIIKLCKPDMAKHITVSGSAEFVFPKAGAVAITADNFIVLPTAHDPQQVYVEIDVNNDAYFSHVMHNEKTFDGINKFFDITADCDSTPLVNYVRRMTIVDSDCVYDIEPYNMMLPNAEEACVSFEMKLNFPAITQEDLDGMDIVALYIRRSASTDIVLKLYVDQMSVSEPYSIYPKATCIASTYDSESERILPEDYHDVMDVIDSLIAMDGEKTCIYAIDSAACCGEDIDLSEPCYPVQDLTMYCTRHGKAHTIKMKGA